MVNIKYHDFGISEAFLFDDFIINQIKEGVELQPEFNKLLMNLITDFYENKNIVYISNRVNSYSVNPLIYNETKKIKNLAGFAVVTKNPIMAKNAKFEKQFFDKPYEIFTTIHEAIKWVPTVLN